MPPRVYSELGVLVRAVYIYMFTSIATNTESSDVRLAQGVLSSDLENERLL